MAPDVIREVVIETSAVSCWVVIGWLIVGGYVAYCFKKSLRENAS